MANLVYNSFKKALLDAEMDFSADTTQEFRILLTTDSYTPNADHTDVSDITNELATGSGYTAFANDNKIITGVLTSRDDTDDEGVLDVDNITWTSSTITARYAVIYKYVDATPANCPLIGVIDFGSDQSSSAGDFSIQISLEGLLNLN